MRRRALLAVLAALALGACGADEEAEALEAMGDYVAALQAGDPEAVCDLLTDAELEDLDVSSSCVEVFTSGFALLAEQGVDVPAFEITEVEVDGDTAEATVVSGSTNQVVPLEQEDGAWKVAGATSISNFHPDDPLGEAP